MTAIAANAVTEAENRVAWSKIVYVFQTVVRPLLTDLYYVLAPVPVCV
jgi:hypothetical protein